MRNKTVTPQSPGLSPWMTPQAAADYAGVGIRKLRDWQKQGLQYIQPSPRITRIHREDLDDYLRGHRVDGNMVDNIVNTAMKGLKKGIK
jgi:hypothetical protein